MCRYLQGIDVLTMTFMLQGIAQSEGVVQESLKLPLRQVAGSSQKAYPES